MDAGGFNFDLCKRNEFLEMKGMKGPGFTKTGTTISGVIFKVSMSSRLFFRSSLLFVTLVSTTISTVLIIYLHLLPTNHLLFYFIFAGWRSSWSRYPLYRGHHRRRQKLRKNPFHRSQHLLLRRWYCRRY